MLAYNAPSLSANCPRLSPVTLANPGHGTPPTWANGGCEQQVFNLWHLMCETLKKKVHFKRHSRNTGFSAHDNRVYQTRVLEGN